MRVNSMWQRGDSQGGRGVEGSDVVLQDILPSVEAVQRSGGPGPRGQSAEGKHVQQHFKEHFRVSV